VVKDKDQDEDHHGSLGTTFATSACHGGCALVARWRPPRKNNDDQQSQTKLILARHDLGHKCIRTQVSTEPEGKGQAAKEGGAHVNANLQQSKYKTAHQLVRTTEDLSSRKSLCRGHDGRIHEVCQIDGNTKQDKRTKWPRCSSRGGSAGSPRPP
jgi:hypothetical protein